MSLPAFPQMRPLALVDRAMIAGRVDADSPSDHDFANLFSWNTAGRTRIAALHGNIIVAFQDYGSEDQVFTILGANEVRDTVAVLSCHVQEVPQARIAMIPDEIAHHLNGDARLIEDRAHFDYLVALGPLARAEGRAYQQFRRAARSFTAPHDLSLVDPGEPAFQADVAAFNCRWSEVRTREAHLEEEAVRRCLAHAADLGAFAFRATVGAEMVFYAIFGPLAEGVAICHFFKANTWDHPGAMQAILREVAGLLVGMGYSFCNFEQDLGLEGLRRFKTSLAPVRMIRKWTIVPQLESV